MTSSFAVRFLSLQLIRVYEAPYARGGGGGSSPRQERERKVSGKSRSSASASQSSERALALRWRERAKFSPAARENPPSYPLSARKSHAPSERKPLLRIWNLPHPPRRGEARRGEAKRRAARNSGPSLSSPLPRFEHSCVVKERGYARNEQKSIERRGGEGGTFGNGGKERCVDSLGGCLSAKKSIERVTRSREFLFPATLVLLVVVGEERGRGGCKQLLAKAFPSRGRRGRSRERERRKRISEFNMREREKAFLFGSRKRAGPYFFIRSSRLYRIIPFSRRAS